MKIIVHSFYTWFLIVLMVAVSLGIQSATVGPLANMDFLEVVCWIGGLGYFITVPAFGYSMIVLNNLEKNRWSINTRFLLWCCYATIAAFLSLSLLIFFDLTKNVRQLFRDYWMVFPATLFVIIARYKQFVQVFSKTTEIK